MSLGIVFLSEVFGTAMLTLLGCGVVANVALKGTKGNSGGFLMVSLGIIGTYIARIYDEVKARPLYLVQETRGFAHAGEPDVALTHGHEERSP